MKLKHIIRDSGIRLFDKSGLSAGRRAYLQKINEGLSRVVCFHEITDANSFENKIQLLIQNFHIVPLDLIVKNIGLHKKITNVAITFDDGFSEQIDIAAPILEKYEIPATFFILSGSVGLTGEEASNYYRNQVGINYAVGPTATQISDLANEPLFQVGCHTHNHLDLGGISNPQEIHTELILSKQSSHLNRYQIYLLVYCPLLIILLFIATNSSIALNIAVANTLRYLDFSNFFNSCLFDKNPTSINTFGIDAPTRT